MKYFLFFLFTILFPYQIYSQNISGSYYSYALNGLKFRENPSQNSKELGKITFGDRVNVIESEKNAKEIIIDGLHGKYVLIIYKGMKGYAFSGYLSRLPAPALTNRWVTLKNYLEVKMEKNGKNEPIEIEDPHNSGFKKKGFFQKYASNICFYNFSEECIYDEKLTIKNISFQEAFLFVTTFHGQYRNIKLDTPSDENKDNRCFCASLKPKEGQYALHMSREKAANGDYNMISICFDAEAGSGCIRVSVNKDDENEVIIEFSYSCS